MTVPVSEGLLSFFMNNKGRWTQRWLDYFPVYERHFAPFKNSAVTVLEIGVNKGGSLAMWRDYFGPEATIIGVDINESCRILENDGFLIEIGDQADETLGDKLGAKVGLEPTSDARLKRDIDHIATRSDGLPIYSFKYLWDDEVYVGVMAQDLLRNEPWRPAVLTKANGYFAVNYRRIGLRMTTLEEWRVKAWPR
jgi:hypothetical protein